MRCLELQEVVQKEFLSQQKSKKMRLYDKIIICAQYHEESNQLLVSLSCGLVIIIQLGLPMSSLVLPKSSNGLVVSAHLTADKVLTLGQ